MGFKIGNLPMLDLGYQGENKARTIEIDMTAWLEEFPGAKVGMMVRRPGEATLYPADLKHDGNIIRWGIKSGDVAIAGEGEAQIILTNEEGVQLRSRVVKTKITVSMSGTEVEAPPPQTNWVQEVLNARDEAVEAAERAESAAGSGSGGGTSGNITPAMIGAAPANHASEDSKYGMATADLFGHVKAAWIDKMLSLGREAGGQDPDLFYDSDGNLIGDAEAAEEHLRGIVPSMWMMTVYSTVINTELEYLEECFFAVNETVYQLKKRVKALEDEIDALKGV